MTVDQLVAAVPMTWHNLATSCGWSWPTLAKPTLAKPTLANFLTDFGQTDFGQFLTDFGQFFDRFCKRGLDRLWQTDFGQF